MIGLELAVPEGGGPRVLCLGAHCDDIELGCGGTILRLAERYPDASFLWVVFASNAERAVEAENSARAFLEGVADRRILVNRFRESFFPYIGAEIKDYFEIMKGEFSPDLILTHYREDRHQDHRVISDLTWNTFRDHLILEYEIVKYDGDMGRPNLFVELAEHHWRRKIELISTHFASQKARSWFDREAMEGIMRIRGVECNVRSRYAEAFHCRKARLAL